MKHSLETEIATSVSSRYYPGVAAGFGPIAGLKIGHAQDSSTALGASSRGLRRGTGYKPVLPPGVWKEEEAQGISVWYHGAYE